MQTTTAEKTETQSKITLTPASLDLLVRIVSQSGDWNNSPMLELDEAGKGNFTDLKKKKLVGSFFDEGISWAIFKFQNGQIVTDGSRSYALMNCENYSTATKLD